MEDQPEAHLSRYCQRCHRKLKRLKAMQEGIGHRCRAIQAEAARAKAEAAKDVNIWEARRLAAKATVKSYSEDRRGN